MNPIEVVTAELRQAAEQLSEGAIDSDALLQSFTSEVESFGQPWGDDMLGMAIGVIYQTAMTLVLDGIRSNLDTIDDQALRLGLAADNYDLTDADLAGRLNAIHDPGLRI